MRFTLSLVLASLLIFASCASNAPASRKAANSETDASIDFTDGTFDVSSYAGNRIGDAAGITTVCLVTIGFVCGHLHYGIVAEAKPDVLKFLSSGELSDDLDTLFKQMRKTKGFEKASDKDLALALLNEKK